MTLPPEKCQCGDSVYEEKTRVGGWFVERFRHDGSGGEGDHDELVYGATPQTVCCAKCGKRYLNPRYGWTEI